ncbi:ABC transporter substrate-binding protein [Candidatus Poriferisocius sp.]|uniref:ABC transporter substrate-binding protein n=1 Tax=Candidatus Poriferisocius sp. TaxID=3101276 RepID=UPI003B58D3B8
MPRKFRWLMLLLVFALFAASCGNDDDSGAGGGDEAPAPSGDTDTGSDDGADDGADDGSDDPPAPAPEPVSITIALGSEPTSLDPHLVDDGGERAVNDNVYETLLARTPNGDLIPGLAADMPTRLDDTTWQFTLRDGITFHNGEPFNADSVVASVHRISRLIDEGVTDNDGFFASLSGAEAVDELTVNITTEAPDGVLPSRMYWLKMIPASAEDAADLSDSVIGTGPYQLTDWTRGESVTLAANPDYWDGAPSITDVEYRFVTESGSRFAGLLSGDYDLITNLNPEDVPQAPQAATAQGQEHPVLILDADEGITADRNVRVALNLAVDKEAIANSLFSGFAVIDAGQLLSPSILGHNPNIEAYPYDPEQAAQLIEDAGVAGETITLVGESSGRWLLDAELVQAVAGYWQEAGLDVDLQLPEFGEYLDVLFDRESRADAIFVSSSNDILDADRQLSTYYQAGGIGSSNSNEQLSGLIDEARAEVDADAREALYQEAVQIAYDEAYFVWLINNEDIYGLSERMSWSPRVDSKLLIKEMSAG